MKKFLSVLTALTLLLSLIPLFSYAADPTTAAFVFNRAESVAILGASGQSRSFLYGDVNVDGKLNARDNLMIKKQLAGFTSDSFDSAAADVNRDGSFNALDLMSLRLYMVRKSANPGRGTVSEGGSLNAYFDASDLSARIAASGGTASATLDLSDENLSASDFTHAVIVYSGADESGMSVYPCAGEVTVPDNDICITFATTASDGYHVKIIRLADCGLWNGNINALSFSLTAADSVSIDSVAFCPNADAACSFATSREVLRNGNGNYESDRCVRYTFSNTTLASAITSSNNATAAYDSAEDALKVTVTAATDPWVYLDLSSKNISADEYKYMAYVYNVPVNTVKVNPSSEIFFCAGDITEPTGGCSTQFDVTKDGFYVYRIFNLSDVSYWNGTVHGLRFDVFFDSAVGDCTYIDSVIFGKDLSTLSTAVDAAKTAAAARISAPDDAAGIWSTFTDSCTTSPLGLGTAYMDKGSPDNPIHFSAGNASLMTEANISSRLEALILKTTGKTVCVEIIDGFGALGDSYAESFGASEMLTCKIITESDSYIVYHRVEVTIKKVIYDHDLGPDCDDAGAASILLKAHKSGEIKLLAITHVCTNQSGAYCIAAMCDYLGITDVAVGTNIDNGKLSGDHNGKCSTTPAAEYWTDHTAPVLESNRAILRRILAAVHLRCGRGKHEIRQSALCRKRIALHVRRRQYRQSRRHRAQHRN